MATYILYSSTNVLLQQGKLSTAWYFYHTTKNGRQQENFSRDFYLYTFTLIPKERAKSGGGEGEETFCPRAGAKPRHTAWILGRQNSKKKNVLSILEKIHPRENQKSKRHFSFWGCRVKRGGGGAFVERTIQFRATTRSARAKHYRFWK